MNDPSGKTILCQSLHRPASRTDIYQKNCSDLEYFEGRSSFREYASVSKSASILTHVPGHVTAPKNEPPPNEALHPRRVYAFQLESPVHVLDGQRRHRSVAMGCRHGVQSRKTTSAGWKLIKRHHDDELSVKKKIKKEKRKERLDSCSLLCPANCRMTTIPYCT